MLGDEQSRLAPAVQDPLDPERSEQGADEKDSSTTAQALCRVLSTVRALSANEVTGPFAMHLHVQERLCIVKVNI